MQRDVKLHHPLFGNKHGTFFNIMCFLYLLDILIIPNGIQLFVLVAILVMIFFWDSIVHADHWSLWVITRAIQIVCALQVLLTFAISLPYIADNWESGESLLSIGVC